MINKILNSNNQNLISEKIKNDFIKRFLKNKNNTYNVFFSDLNKIFDKEKLFLEDKIYLQNLLAYEISNELFKLKIISNLTKKRIFEKLKYKEN